MSNEGKYDQIFTVWEAEVGNRFEPKVAKVLTGDFEGLKITNYQVAGEHSAHRMQEAVGKSPVLEVCTGIGATTFVLARTFPIVYAVDLNPKRLAMCRKNLELLGLSDRVELIEGDILDPKLLGYLSSKGIRAAYTDANFTKGSDWAENHALDISQTGPSTPKLYHQITQKVTGNIVMKLPKTINLEQLRQLADSEIERAVHEEGLSFYLAYFGNLARKPESEFRFSKMAYNS